MSTATPVGGARGSHVDRAAHRPNRPPTADRPEPDPDRKTSSTQHGWAGEKAEDAWWTVLVIDPLAAPVVRRLVRHAWVTPNRVTAVAGVLGIAAVLAFATGRFALGAVLFELRFFVDCLDGKIARLRNLRSALGAQLDRISDGILVNACFVAVVWHEFAGMHGPFAMAGRILPVLAVVVTYLETALSGLRANAPRRQRAETAAPSFFARHRLARRPWTVEAETVTLFLAPLVLPHGLRQDLIVAMLGPYACFMLIDLLLIFGTAAAADRARG